MDELEAAQKATEKIHELREQLDRLRALVYATHGLGGGLLDATVASHASTKQLAPNDSERMRPLKDPKQSK